MSRNSTKVALRTATTAVEVAGSLVLAYGRGWTVEQVLRHGNKAVRAHVRQEARDLKRLAAVTANAPVNTNFRPCADPDCDYCGNTPLAHAKRAWQDALDRERTESWEAELGIA